MHINWEIFIYVIQVLLNFKFSCCFWCWKSTREYQISNSRATRITNSLSLIQTWWGTDNDIFFGKIFRYFTKTKMPSLVFREQLIHIIQAQCTCEMYLWIVDTCSKYIPVLQCFVLKKHNISTLETLEQILSAFLTASRSILGQFQGKNCNHPMLITAFYLFLTRESPGF